MDGKNLHLITVGYAKQALSPGSREHARMVEYARELKTLDIIVFTLRRDGYTESVRQGNLTVYPTNSRYKILIIFDAIRIGRILLHGKMKEKWIISSQDPFETSIVGRVLSRAYKISHHVQLHGDNYSNTKWRSESVLNTLRYYFGLCILRSSPNIRVVSERIKRSLVTHSIPPDRITVLPIRPELERFLSVRRDMRDTKGTFQFLAMSRFSQEKNIPLIIRAFAAIHVQYADTRLAIAGRGPLEPELRELVEVLDLMRAVHFLPWTDKPESLFAVADVFLLASDHEAYGLTLIEAMATGLPVITTDVGCAGEVVRDRIHGIIVPVGDEAAYARAMREVVEHPECIREWGEAGRRAAEGIAQTSKDAYVKAWVAQFCDVKKEI